MKFFHIHQGLDLSTEQIRKSGFTFSEPVSIQICLKCFKMRMAPYIWKWLTYEEFHNFVSNAIAKKKENRDKINNAWNQMTEKKL
jgi:hypothetical protein